MEFTVAFLIGLAGSFHCAGMCGPIALSLSPGNRRNISFLLKRTAYNGGRVVSYASLGLIFGFIGDRLSIFGLQRWLSIMIGSLLILFVLLAYAKAGKPLSGRLYGLFLPFFSKAYSRLRHSDTFLSMLFIGILNGLLPCGFVYLGLGGAAALGSAADGAVYMAMFGLGTVPVMLGVTIFGNIVSSGFRRKIAKLVPVMVLLLGLLFVLRGLNLGIPYLSPAEKASIAPVQEVICH